MLYFKTITSLAVLMLLASCGFHPLHGKYGNIQASAELATIEIKPITDRIGQQLRNHLLDSLNPYGRPIKPRYTLTVKLSENIQHLAVEKSSFATRANLRMSANFTLKILNNNEKPLNDKAKNFSGTSRIISSYNILNSEFATLMAEKNARNRAIKEIADDISTRLAVFFVQKSTP